VIRHVRRAWPTSPRPGRPAGFSASVRAVVDTNLAWTVLSCPALALWLSPSTTGTLKARQDISE
jgi:hypothetical protein